MEPFASCLESLYLNFFKLSSIIYLNVEFKNLFIKSFSCVSLDFISFASGLLNINDI